MKALERHLWYLTPEMVVFGLFGNAVPNEDRQALGKALIDCRPEQLPDRPLQRKGSGFGKPTFPKLNPASTLADLVEPDSWWTIKLLGLNLDFVEEDIKEWEASESYISSKKIVESLNVVNDPTERAVKLSSDFVDSARGEDHYQNLLQVVENDRTNRPNLRNKGKGKSSKRLKYDASSN